jgi:hypothetical protein
MFKTTNSGQAMTNSGFPWCVINDQGDVAAYRNDLGQFLDSKEMLL